MDQDRFGNIHILYGLNRSLENNPAGIYYAKYDINGRLLIEPFRPFDVNNLQKYRLLISDSTTHIFAAFNNEYYHTVLNLDGERIIETHLVEGLYHPLPDSVSFGYIEPWNFDIRNDGTIVGSAILINDIHLNCIVFANLSSEGALIDEIETISEFSREGKADIRIVADDFDNAHLVWRETYGYNISKYSKVSNQNDVVVEEQRLDPLNQDNWNFCIDIKSHNERLYLLFSEGRDKYIKKMDLEGNLIFNMIAFIDPFIHSEYSFAIYRDFIHLTSGIQVPEDEAAVLAYMSMDTLGHITDSLSLFFRFQPECAYDGANRYTKIHNDTITFCFRYSQLHPRNYSELCIVQGRPEGGQKISEKDIEEYPALKNLMAFPNPMNTGTLITFYLLKPSYLTYSFFTFNGRLLSSYKEYFTAGIQSIYWNGNLKSGRLLPAGSYIFTIGNNEMALDKAIVIIR